MPKDMYSSYWHYRIYKPYRSFLYANPTQSTVSAAVAYYGYIYVDANRKDKLAAINNVAIFYDAIGNPTSDGTWTYAWAKGRQLQSMSKSGTSVSFTYNEDNLRIVKI